jgi:hypothetical protein
VRGRTNLNRILAGFSQKGQKRGRFTNKYSFLYCSLIKNVGKLKLSQNFALQWFSKVSIILRTLYQEFTQWRSFFVTRSLPACCMDFYLSMLALLLPNEPPSPSYSSSKPPFTMFSIIHLLLLLLLYNLGQE